MAAGLQSPSSRIGGLLQVKPLAKANDQPQAKAVFAELEQLPEPDRENTCKALLDYLNKGGKIEPSDTAASPGAGAITGQDPRQRA